MSTPRLKQILNLLDGETVDIDNLKTLCTTGCPDVGGIRAKVWKFVLNYLPPDLARHKEKLAIYRAQYKGYVKEFVVESCAKNCHSADHPLSSEPHGNWLSFFKDNEILLQINKDCQRLCPDFDFFRRATDHPISKLFGPDVPVGILRRRGETCALQSQSLDCNLVGVTNMIQMQLYDPFLPGNRLSCGLRHDSDDNPVDKCSNNSHLSPLEETHWEVIERILFVYYKTHVCHGYVQGMNEIIAPIYYVFATDPTESCRRFAEVDAFYCFNNLMTEIYPNFVRKPSKNDGVDISGQMKVLANLLDQFDPALSKHLTDLTVVPEHFAFRWLSLLLAREFLLPDVLHLWDTLFCDENRFSLLPYVCCAMLICIRDKLLEADFPVAIQLVQNYPPAINLSSIISKAKSLYSTRRQS